MERNVKDSHHLPLVLVLHGILCIISYPHQQASALSIVSTNTFKEGSQVNVTCNADAVDIDPNAVVIVASVEIGRKTPSSGSDKYFKILDMSALEYALFPDKPDYYRKNISQGRKWTVSIPSKETLSNKDIRFKRENVFATLTINDATCTDSGLYFCFVDYRLKPSVGPLSKRIGQVMGKAPPPVILELDSESDVLNINDTISVSCEGLSYISENNTIVWKRKCPGLTNGTSAEFVEWPMAEGRVRVDKQSIKKSKGGCVRFVYKETLEFNMSAALDNCIVRCDFINSDDPSQEMTSGRKLSIGLNIMNSGPGLNYQSPMAKLQMMVTSLMTCILGITVITHFSVC